MANLEARTVYKELSLTVLYALQLALDFRPRLKNDMPVNWK